MNQLSIAPHPKAPMFSGPDGELILKQAISEISSQNAQISNQIVRDVLAQAGYVNLWFFLKYIAGFTGPFDLLNEDLHVDMCNTRQRWLYPGARGAMFIPRNHFKSAICTEGGTGWEILRDPDLRVRISNAIAEKAEAFMDTVRGIYDSNPLVQELYPDYYVANAKNQPRWNAKELVLPNRTRNYREPTVHSGGVTGASEGWHVDLHIVDDMIGLAALNAMRQSNAVMEDTKHWFWSAANKSLLLSLKNSRVIVIGTRYSVDDVYSEIINRAYLNLGYPLRGFVPNEKGTWEIYYRMGIENEEVIFPEMASLDDYMDMAETDWWGYVTQFVNDPQGAGLTEWSDYDIFPCRMDYDEQIDKWIIFYQVKSSYVKVHLEDCDLIQACDPAATERYISAKTSRSAVVILATDCYNNRYILDIKAGYVPTSEVFNWLFANKKKFPQIRATFLESSGPFKLLGPLLRDEEVKRGEWLNVRPFPAVGDKDARIRTALQPELENRRVFVVENFVPLFEAEMMVFPQAAYKKDILDATSSAVSNALRPSNPEEIKAMVEQDEVWESRKERSNVCGY